jgi:hypothetical protein
MGGRGTGGRERIGLGAEGEEGGVQRQEREGVGFGGSEWMIGGRRMESDDRWSSAVFLF